MSQYNLALIEHEVNHQPIYQRASDGYVNATAMCKAAGKQMKHYLENKSTTAFLNELQSVVGIPTTELVQIIQGGDPQLQGTWVHPQVAINLAQWCSPQFAVQVSGFIFDWMSGNNPAQKIIQQWQPYMERTSILYRSVPQGYFSIFHEAAPMIVGLIQSGVIVNDKTVPDISIGKTWAKYWQDNLASNHSAPQDYAHYYPESFPQSASNPQMAKAYPNTALGDFRLWMDNVYLPEKFPKYLNNKQRQGAIDAVTANTLIDRFAPKQIN